MKSSIKDGTKIIKTICSNPNCRAVETTEASISARCMFCNGKGTMIKVEDLIK